MGCEQLIETLDKIKRYIGRSRMGCVRHFIIIEKPLVFTYHAGNWLGGMRCRYNQRR